MATLVLAKNKTTGETSWLSPNILKTFPNVWELSPKGKAIASKKEEGK